MNRADVVAKLEENIANAEAAYARSLRRVNQAVADGTIPAEGAEDRPGLKRQEARLAFLRRELAGYGR